MPKHYGHRLRILHWCADQTITNALASMELTAAQGPILGYLAHRQTPPCAKDIEEAFRLSHPTVSGILGRLEKKGFVEFRSDQLDRRCKRVYILPKGRACCEAMHALIRSTEEKLVEGFTEEEKNQFSAFLDRAIANMGARDCRQKEEPET